MQYCSGAPCGAGVARARGMPSGGTGSSRRGARCSHCGTDAFVLHASSFALARRAYSRKRSWLCASDGTSARES
eukprot:5206736-Pleurochrysis_carterae.AAC.1